MTRRAEKPTEKPSLYGHGTQFEHPAFGQVVLTHPRGGRSPMFGSELEHSDVMRIEVRQATQQRFLSDSRVVEGPLIVQFEFTLAQWSQFISSQGMGAGTPCTLQAYRAQGDMVLPPEIERVEPHQETFRREMAAKVSEALHPLNAALDQLEAALTAGGKGAAKKALEHARHHVHNLPENVRFVDERFAESMEKIVSDAKIEVENFVVSTALRTGIEALRNAGPKMQALAGPCARCGGTGTVEDGEMIGDGAAEFSMGPIRCVNDCPACGGRKS